MRIKFFMLITLIFFSFQAQANQPILTSSITQKMLQEKNDPEDFATILYGLVLAHEQVNLNDENKLAALFFSQDFLVNYNKVYKKDSKSGEVGCIDASIFTGAQDVYQGFWLGKAKEQGKEILIPVYLEMNNEAVIPAKPSVTVQLVKTTQGWKVDDIIYAGEKKSLRGQLKTCLAVVLKNIPSTILERS